VLYRNQTVSSLIKSFKKGGVKVTDSEKLDLLLADMQNMKSDMQNMKSDMQNMKSDMQNVKNDLQEVKQKVINIDLTLENEIRVNIRRVAEGHFGFSRNLHENEMLSIRVNILESELRRIKERLDHIA
jgi:outer membrane murein-binding lipoprotein Lpp